MVKILTIERKSYRHRILSKEKRNGKSKIFLIRERLEKDEDDVYEPNIF